VVGFVELESSGWVGEGEWVDGGWGMQIHGMLLNSLVNPYTNHLWSHLEVNQTATPVMLHHIPCIHNHVLTT
jgi:hypothetical protein